MPGSKPIHVECYKLTHTHNPKGTLARYAGRCMAGDACVKGGTISQGDTITFLRYRTSKEGREVEVTEEQETIARGVAPYVPPPAPTTIPTGNGMGDPVAQALAAILMPLVAGHVDAALQAKLQGCDPEVIVKRAEEAIARQIAAISLPRQIEVKRVDGTTHNVGFQHKQFRQLLAYLASGQNVYIVGPAGTGKTTAVEQAFAALAKPLNSLSSITDRHGEVYGFRDAHGVYHESLVFDAYTRGKGMLVDEIDGSEPAELLSFNQVTANGRASFCNTMAERHPECQFVATANTFGTGANAEYTGRARLDASTLDRFVILEWDIDEELERTTCGDAAWCKYVQAVRAKVASKGIKHLVTPRASYKGAALLASLRANGFAESEAWEMACKSVLRRNLTADQWNSVK